MSDSEIKTLTLAISEEPELSYTDIEMFYIDDDEIPYFGPDYDFNIVDSVLIGNTIKIQIKKLEKASDFNE